MDKSGLYTIGEISKVSSISVDTLRYYDKAGLLTPSVVDKDTGYRYYDTNKVWITDMILILRRMNMSIEEIKSLFAATNNEEVTSYLAKQKGEARRLSEYYALVAEDIEWYEKQNEILQEAEVTDVIEVKRFKASKAICGWNSETHDYHKRLDEAMVKYKEMYGLLKRHYGFVADIEQAEKGKFAKLAEFVQFEDHEPDRSDEEELLKLPAGEYACFIAKEDHGKMDFAPLFSWLEKNGRETDLIIADEIGLQLLDIFKTNHMMKIRAHLKRVKK
jgi:DNA-binding transcriptional MerR regulator